jgi:protoporphyrinogen oxidase
MKAHTPNPREVIIVGAGYTGLSAALDLCKAGCKVTIYERDSDVGGLAGTFELSPGIRVEKFYHHWFTSDVDVLDLIDELGLGHLKQYRNSNTGLYYTNSIFRLASPLDLLSFSPLPLIDRVRTGLMALQARRVNEWKPLEDISAKEWLIRYGGRKAFDVIWSPLMQGKFGVEADNVSAVWIWNKLKLRGSSRNKKGGESLVYFGGGFGALTDGIRKSLESMGVTVSLQTEVKQIIVENGRAVGVETDRGVHRADAVLATVPLPLFSKMTPGLPQDFRAQCDQIRFLGNSCLVLRLSRSLSSTYWLNVADPSFPFVGIIEHTNLDPKENYNGDHIVYLSKYLPTSEKLFSFTTDEMLEYCIPFIQKIFPQFDRSWILSHHVWKAHYSQPVITKHYSSLIPSLKTPIDDLWLCTMAQIYPEDRGTNYAVRYGRRVAKEMLASFNTGVSHSVQSSSLTAHAHNGGGSCCGQPESCGAAMTSSVQALK